MTVALAIVIFFLIPDFPEQARWLTDEEKSFVKARLAEDIGDSQPDAQPTWRDVLGIFKDPKIILSGLAYFGMAVPGYSYAFFAPTILRSLGYSPTMTQLYSVPPTAAAFVVSMIVATASDYYKRRYIFILPLLLISSVGIITLLNVHDGVSVRYGMLCLILIGQAGAVPIIIVWFNANRESTSTDSSGYII